MSITKSSNSLSDLLSSSQMDNIEEIAYLMSSPTGVEIKNRKYHFKTYKKCFVSKEAVIWLKAYLNCDANTAVAVGQRMVDLGFVQHVVDENKPFENGFYFYRINKQFLFDYAKKKLKLEKKVSESNISKLTQNNANSPNNVPNQASVEGQPLVAKKDWLTTRRERMAEEKENEKISIGAKQINNNININTINANNNSNINDSYNNIIVKKKEAHLVIAEQLQSKEQFSLQEKRSPYGVGCQLNNCHIAMMKKWNEEGDFDEEDEKVIKEAKEFIVQYYTENKLNINEMNSRIEEVVNEIKRRGTYKHTYNELSYGAKLCWRNASRCINRIQWKNLEIIDKREIKNANEMIQSIFEHLKFATNGGNIKSTMTIFPQKERGNEKKRPPRVWNSQLIRYAGYLTEDGSIVGDPSNLEFTQVCMKLGWKGKGSNFDILPVIVEFDGQLIMKEIPSDLVLEVPIHHPTFEWLKEMNYRWYAVPAISNFAMDIGGIKYSAIPFNGWYMGTEIGRDLADEGRYNCLPEMALNMGLKITNTTLWKDRCFLELNLAILYSFQKFGVTITDHHSVSDSFISFYRNEVKERGNCPADWVWIVPPISSSTTQVFHLEMINYYLKPALIPQDFQPWKNFDFKKYKENLENQIQIDDNNNSKEIKMIIVYGSETGKSENFAQKLHKKVTTIQPCDLFCLDEFDYHSTLRKSNQKICILFITSTFGSGSPPRNAVAFFDWLRAQKEPFENKNIVFGVFGCCNRVYSSFNAAARFISEKMTSLNATEIISIGEGDELEGQEMIFNQWQSQLFSILKENIANFDQLKPAIKEKKIWTLKPSSSPSSPPPPPSSSSPPYSRTNFYTGKIVENFCLLKEGENNDRSTHLIQIDISDYQNDEKEENKNKNKKYEAGDHIGILPENCSNLVDRILILLKIENPDDYFIIEGNDDRIPSYLRSPITYREVLRYYIDITTPPSPDLLKIWAKFATEKEEVDEISELSKGAEYYKDWITLYPNLAQLLEQFKSLNIPFLKLVKHSPNLQARFYSISSSPLLYPNEVHITVAKVTFTYCGIKHFGVSSNFLCNSKKNNSVRLFIRKADFHLPSDENIPVICIGAGTGVAPFRSFWQDVSMKLRKGKTAIYFGCRNAPEHLYFDEKEELLQKGVIQTSKVAYSRTQAQKIYVNHVLENDGEDVFHQLTQQKARIYICGDIKMAEDVFKSVIKIYEQWGKLSSYQASLEAEKLKTEGRYLLDIYGLTLHVKKTTNQNKVLWEKVLSKTVVAKPVKVSIAALKDSPQNNSRSRAISTFY